MIDYFCLSMVLYVLCILMRLNASKEFHKIYKIIVDKLFLCVYSFNHAVTINNQLESKNENRSNIQRRKGNLFV